MERNLMKKTILMRMSFSKNVRNCEIGSWIFDDAVWILDIWVDFSLL
jgi:hypothetical protein